MNISVYVLLIDCYAYALADESVDVGRLRTSIPPGTFLL